MAWKRLTKDNAMHDDYKQLETPAGIARCPVCGSEAQLWQYSESPNSPVKRLVMCSHGDKIGPQSGLIHEGCLLYMPGDDFYRDTAKDAARFWNEFAAALVALRTSGVSAVEPTALERFNRDPDLLANETPLERLRYFLSLALSGQDWLDVEPFLDALGGGEHDAG